MQSNCPWADRFSLHSPREFCCPQPWRRGVLRAPLQLFNLSGKFGSSRLYRWLVQWARFQWCKEFSTRKQLLLSGLLTHRRTVSHCLVCRITVELFRAISHNFPEFRFILQLLSGLSSHGCFASGSSGSYFHDLNPGSTLFANLFRLLMSSRLRALNASNFKVHELMFFVFLGRVNSIQFFLLSCSKRLVSTNEGLSFEFWVFLIDIHLWHEIHVCLRAAFSFAGSSSLNSGLRKTGHARLL